MPNFSYLIENIIMFDFLGVQHLLVSFENKSVQIIEVKSGNSIHEFNFGERRPAPLDEEDIATREPISARNRQNSPLASYIKRQNLHSATTGSRSLPRR